MCDKDKLLKQALEKVKDQEGLEEIFTDVIEGLKPSNKKIHEKPYNLSK